VTKNRTVFPALVIVWFASCPILEIKGSLSVDIAEGAFCISTSSEPDTIAMSRGPHAIDERVLGLRSNYRQLSTLRLAEGISCLKAIFVIKDAIETLEPL
jgi:hypothetical protein